MAQVKPLVLDPTTGKPRNIQAGEYIGEVYLPKHINGETGSLSKCQVVYISASNTVKKARADASGTLPAYGLCAENIASGVSGTIQTDGNLTATASEWDSVTGQTGGLTPNATYFVSNSTAGLLTTTPPTTGYVQSIGLAVSETTMKIKINNEIKL